MRIGFRFRWIPFIATVLLVALGISLGQWQERRAEQKLALAAKLAAGNSAAPLLLGPQPLDAQALEWRRVAVTGRYLPGWALYLDNRPYQGRAGFYVLMPFQIADTGMHVLVERGWLPRNTRQREHMAPYTTPNGTVTIFGIVRLNAGHVMQLGVAPQLRPNAIVQNVDIGQVAAASGLVFQSFVLQQTGPAIAGPAASGTRSGAAGDEALQPFVLQQTGPGDDHLVRDWPAPALGVDTHRGYAFQWYALALMAFLFFVLTGFRRGTK